jgi:hypothetical protein
MAQRYWAISVQNLRGLGFTVSIKCLSRKHRSRFFVEVGATGKTPEFGASKTTSRNVQTFTVEPTQLHEAGKPLLVRRGIVETAMVIAQRVAVSSQTPHLRASAPLQDEQESFPTFVSIADLRQRKAKMRKTQVAVRTLVLAGVRVPVR